MRFKIFHDTLISILEPEELSCFDKATYFILESSIESGDNVLLASLEDAEDAGDYRLHVGLPDRPNMRSAFRFTDLASAVEGLADIKLCRPDTPVWLSCMEIQAKIEGADMWLGVLNARASVDPSDDDCPWVQLAADFAAGCASRDSYGDEDRDHEMYAAIARQIGRQ